MTRSISLFVASIVGTKPLRFRSLIALRFLIAPYCTHCSVVALLVLYCDDGGSSQVNQVTMTSALSHLTPRHCHSLHSIISGIHLHSITRWGHAVASLTSPAVPTTCHVLRTASARGRLTYDGVNSSYVCDCFAINLYEVVNCKHAKFGAVCSPPLHSHHTTSFISHSSNLSLFTLSPTCPAFCSSNTF